eukprot:3813357-Rhodomonas_salina.1
MLRWVRDSEGEGVGGRRQGVLIQPDFNRMAARNCMPRCIEFRVGVNKGNFGIGCERVGQIAHNNVGSATCQQRNVRFNINSNRVAVAR